MSAHAITTFRYDSGSRNFIKKTVDRQLGLKEILIKITHSGLCYTDVHAKDKGCGLGHEGVGSVEKVGDAVSNMKVGDRVGWGWLRSSCGQCSSCLDGYRQYCASASGFAFCDLEQGAFADYHIIDSAFAYHIPDYMLSSHASVFMCAGASTYEALIAAGTKSSDRVGVVGLGGLGHMAVQFAKAMGCNVTVLSDSAANPSAAGKAESKAKDAFDLGADEVRAIKDPAIALTRDREGLVVYLGPRWYDFEASSDHRAINVLLVCASETPDFEKVLPLLARRAVIVLMSIQTQPLNIPYMPFILPGHKLISSTEASTRNHLEMIKFADRHKIKPWIEEFELTDDGLREAFERLESGTMRYRGVVKVPGTRGNGMADALEAFNRLR